MHISIQDIASEKSLQSIWLLLYFLFLIQDRRIRHTHREREQYWLANAHFWGNWSSKRLIWAYFGEFSSLFEEKEHLLLVMFLLLKDTWGPLCVALFLPLYNRTPQITTKKEQPNFVKSTSIFIFSFEFCSYMQIFPFLSCEDVHKDDYVSVLIVDALNADPILIYFHEMKSYLSNKETNNNLLILSSYMFLDDLSTCTHETHPLISNVSTTNVVININFLFNKQHFSSASHT